MNPPLFATLLLFLGPALILLGGRGGILCFGFLVLVGALASQAGVLQAGAMGLTVSYFLALLGTPGLYPARGLALWTAACSLPLWAPAGPFWWVLWPGAGLASAAWDPLAQGWLYECWGSGAPMRTPGFWSVWGIYLLLGLSLRGGIGLASILKLLLASSPQPDET